MNSFTQEVIDHLEYYVYALVNPDDKTIFYIGKGNKNRVFSHDLKVRLNRMFYNQKKLVS